MKKTIFLALCMLTCMLTPALASETNEVYVDDFTVTAGQQYTMSVKMRNTVSIQGFQFDVYLPEGFSFLTGDGQRPDGVALSTERTTADAHDYFNYAFQQDGALRVLCTSTKGKTFSGTDGEIVTITISVAEDTPVGSYSMSIQNTVMTDVNVKGHEADFWEMVAQVTPAAATVTIPEGGVCTYSHSRCLDFSGQNAVKAYIASGFSPSTATLLLTRAEETPAGEGLLLKGEPGVYSIPFGDTDMYYSNLLVGVTTPTVIAPVQDDYTNFILANGKHGMAFYTLEKAGEIAANRAYLQIPTALVGAARQLNIAFDDETTGIRTIGQSDISTIGQFDNFYDLSGRKLSNSQIAKGLYIKNGQKMIVK